MIKMFVLIIVLGVDGSSQEEGLTIVSQEFNTLESCQTAMKSIIQQTNSTGQTRVRSSGCYQK